jgi:hypothetical protein
MLAIEFGRRGARAELFGEKHSTASIHSPGPDHGYYRRLGIAYEIRALGPPGGSAEVETHHRTRDRSQASLPSFAVVSFSSSCLQSGLSIFQCGYVLDGKRAGTGSTTGIQNFYRQDVVKDAEGNLTPRWPAHRDRVV